MDFLVIVEYLDFQDLVGFLEFLVIVHPGILDLVENLGIPVIVDFLDFLVIVDFPEVE